MGIPALERGLVILETLIRSDRALRYLELKQSLPGISDASLNRLLVTLVDNGCIGKVSDGAYALRSRVTGWGKYLRPDADFNSRVGRAVERLAALCGESAAFALYTGEKIEIIGSISHRDSISIIRTGSILHYESDHAAALAILDSLPPSDLETALASPFSRISDRNEYLNGLAEFAKGDYYLDESRLRRGISRIAVPVIVPPETPPAAQAFAVDGAGHVVNTAGQAGTCGSERTAPTTARDYEHAAGRGTGQAVTQAGSRAASRIVMQTAAGEAPQAVSPTTAQAAMRASPGAGAAKTDGSADKQGAARAAMRAGSRESERDAQAAARAAGGGQNAGTRYGSLFLCLPTVRVRDREFRDLLMHEKTLLESVED